METLENEEKKNQERIHEMKEELIKLGGNEKDQYLANLENENVSLRYRTLKTIILKATSQKLRDLAIRSFDYYDSLPYKRLEYAARVYFNRIMGASLNKIEFESKTEASQIGRLVVVDVIHENGQMSQEKFHAKTHRHGAYQTYEIGRLHLTRIASFDPKELFVYSLLQNLALGPEVHFFGLDSKDFYICTKNVPNFTTCEQMVNIIRKDSREWIHLCNELVKLDVISRILTLIDTTTNPGNFAFSFNSPSDFKLTVFDFVVNDRHSYEEPTIVQNFMAGNSINAYVFNKAPLLKFAFATRDAVEQKRVALEFLGNLNFEESVQMAKTRIEIILDSLVTSDLDQDEKMMKKGILSAYFCGIIRNYKLFLSS